MTHALNNGHARRLNWILASVIALWFTAVVAGAQTGFFASLYMPWIAVIVATTIAVPTAWYFTSSRLRQHMEAIGHRRLMLLHVWRIPAALLFFWYGLRGELPPVFWILAGTGDLIAGSFAAYLMFKPESAARYRSLHTFGFADFIVAVGTGLTYTLMLDPRMALIATLPMALIPLFGVGISGATHLIAFDMLRRGVGMAAAPAVTHRAELPAGAQ
jgi:hypothetical protein